MTVHRCELSTREQEMLADYQEMGEPEPYTDEELEEMAAYDASPEGRANHAAWLVQHAAWVAAGCPEDPNAPF
jgi:hypothetical protein